MQKQTHKSKKGFTIVEVTIVTAFVAMLLIAITVIITSMSAMFQKGLVLNAINSVGRNIVSELTQSINTAPSIDSTSLCNMYLNGSEEEITKCIRDGANNFIFQSWEHPARDTTTGVENNVQYYGLFCTGYYTYVWNTWYGKDNSNTLKLRYTKSDLSVPAPLENFKLLRFKDTNYRACQKNVDRNNYDHIKDPEENTIDIRTLANEIPNPIPDPQDGFLESSEANLELYELVMFPVSQDVVTLRAFFAGTFILATGNGDVNIVRSGDYCDLTPTDRDDVETGGGSLDMGSNFNYCGINKFNFAARTAGSGV